MNVLKEAGLEDYVLFRIKKSILLLFLIVFLALLLRLWLFNGLNWDDDPDYVWRANQLKTGNGFIYRDNNGFRIGTYYPAAIAYFLFGINNFSVGFYALVISLLSIAAIYSLAKLLFNTETGLIAALLLAFYPLDVELASRMMPDGLLAGFSLFALYFLFKGDQKNLEGESLSLRSIASYIASGLLLGWCTLVNMSSFVFFLFFPAYFFFSIFTFKKKMKKIGFLKGFFKILILRYALVFSAFLLVACLEGVLYYKHTGDFFFKYKNTLTHFSVNRGFNTDLSLYPRIMFHVNSQGKFQFQGKENSYYGFYYIFAFFALIYGLTQVKTKAYLVNLWFLVVWLYLQWGSMSFSKYMPMHRLPRHLSLATPGMILTLAYFLGNFKPREIKRYLTPATLVFLIVSSFMFNYYRHQSLEDSVLPQKMIHNYLEFLASQHVYAANNTSAYQKFLDHFKDKGREYHDILNAIYNRYQNAYVIIGEHRNWMDTARLIWPDGGSRIPENWELIKQSRVEGKLDRPPFEIKIFRLLTTPIAELKVRNYEMMREFLLSKFPVQFNKYSELILSWECSEVDGADELILKDEQLALRHLEFMEPNDIKFRVFKAVPKGLAYDYRIIKEQGRGEVRITEFPSRENNFILKIRVDDGPFPSFDYYRFFLIAIKKEH